MSVEDLTNAAERMGQADTSAEARGSVSPTAQDKMAVRDSGPVTGLEDLPITGEAGY